MPKYTGSIENQQELRAYLILSRAWISKLQERYND